jgi:large subunit ribosomal protein L10
MNRDQKAAVIDQIAADITGSQAVFAVDYRGITVAQADALRARLRDCDASFRVVKNSLTERAADQAGAAELRPLLAGPTALTFVRGDAAAAAKAISDFARTTQLLAFKGGLMEGAVLSSADVTQISRLPSRDVLYGQLVGLIASPIAGLARTLSALIGGLAVGLGGVLEQRGGVPADAVAAETVADAAPEAEAEAEADATPEAEAETETVADAAPEAEAETETVADAAPEADAEAETVADAAPEAEAEPETVAEAAPEAEAEPEAVAEADAEPEAEAEAETVAEAAPEAEAEPEAVAEADAEPEAEAAEPGAQGTNDLEDAGEPASETDESKEN